MIQATATSINASVNGPLVYLDNWAIGEVAEGDPERRRRLVYTIRSGIDLLFSVANAAELAGPQGRSADAVRAFLDEIGPHWFPAEVNVTEVVNRELRGVAPGRTFFAEHFFKSYIVLRMKKNPSDERKIIDCSGQAFCLGGVLDWVGPQRESIRRGSREFDHLIENKLNPVRSRAKHDSEWLEKKFPLIPFDAARPAGFVYLNLLRVMATEGNSLKKGDGLDFCHAVIACAFAGFAALDKHWKRRALRLPMPNRLARIYSADGLDNLVADMEAWLSSPDRISRSFSRG